SAFVVPVLVIGQAAWATYVVCYQLAHQRLIMRDDQRGPGYAVIVLQALFIFMSGVTYMRLIQVIYTDPGLLPLGISRAKPEDQPNDDMKADMFIVAADGLPRWCKTCETFKPDRTHHCSDLGRCVRRMDHFCPWVGGIVSETTTKFFVQFLLYVMLLCIFVLATTATLFKRDHDRYAQHNPQLIALLVLSGVYTLFTVGMFYNSLWMLAKNFSTVEQRQFGMPLHLAVRISPAWFTGNIDHLRCYMVVSFPSVPGERWAVFQTEPCAKLWDLGSAYANVCQVLGNRVWEWFLPFTYSPCAKHADDISEYPFGPV
ncbi:DHHC palmitoyltransferase-domain-containing protein, partial [Phyllosticta paracitricarpa]